MKTQAMPKMPRKLKKWFKKQLPKYLWRQDAMTWADYKKMDKLFNN
jgi:hypothetical protein